MSHPGITYSDYYIPDHSVSIEQFIIDLPESGMPQGVNRKQITEILSNIMGFQCVYIDERKNEPMHFHKLLERYFLESGSRPEEIDLLLYTDGDSVSIGNPWSATDSECVNIPYFVKREFKLDNALLFNVEVECAATLVAVRIALSMFRDGSIRKALILSRNFFPYDRRLMGGATVVSDGVGIMELSKEVGDYAIVDFTSIADGSISRVFEYNTKSQLLVETGAKVISSLTARNSLKLSDISLIIPQNTTRIGWERYCKILDYPMNRVFLSNVFDGGHMGDVDIIRNLTDIHRQGLLTAGDFAIAYAVGTGTTWAGLLIQKQG
ncbi:3-oxoacyl-[acyl-carrier-protein] synthase III C-terminal domain-containing protein [Microcoleus sp. F4-D5]|uniref:3-oxoacyl-[acyl-carrier-protein] synthase III C-terminal domain-containing protein n=1 Tax=Microcoleus sp. F4-D5 TaxID=2818760 RepID=UPI002FD50358